MNFEVLSTLSGTKITNVSQIVKQGFTGSNSGKSITGAILIVDNVHSISQGVVTDVNREPQTGLYVITVRYSPNMWFRYCLLSDISVEYNQTVMPHDVIGKAYRNNIRFEYCTLESSPYIVRFPGITCYKHDPLPILYGEIQLYISPTVINQPSDKFVATYTKPIKYDSAKLSSITNSSGSR